MQSTTAPSDARELVRRACADLHVEDVADTATLLTSELVTNAVRHAAGPVQIGVACTQGRLVVSVSDGDPRPPRPRRPQAVDGGGRGLLLVSKLADRWGFHQWPGDGKAVWFALRPAATPVAHGDCRCGEETVETTFLAEPPIDMAATVSIPTSRDVS